MTAQMLQQAEGHLNNALKLEPDSIEAHQVLGRLYFKMHNWDLAKTHLLAVASAKPDTALLLAMLAREQNDDIGMRQWAGTAAEYYRGKVGKATEENPPDRLAWATALAIQDRYAEAAEILKTGMKNSSSKIYISGLANIYADWAAHVAKTDPHNIASRLELIQQGLEFDPQNLGLLEQLLLLTHLPEPEAKSAQAMLTQMLAQGGSSAMLHFVVGNDAYQRGDVEQAGEHFKLAFELAPNLPVVANRMALMLAIGKQPDLPRALAISQTLVEKYPNEPEVRNTHGIILAHLGRWEEAVKDLEFALPNLRDKSATHTALALAYRNLGLTGLADEHERLSRETPEPSAPAASNP
jgi:tetratricopeptide (TPR) repeat protein